MKRVLSVGLLVCDVPLRPVPPGIFEEDRCHIEKPLWGIGGDAANVAVALTRLGGRTEFCGLVGNDLYGEFLIRRLEEAGVGLAGLKRHPELGTGVSHILIEPGGERHFILYKAINDALDYDDIDEELIAASDIVYLGSIMSLQKMDEGGTARLFQKAKALGKTTAADFGGNGVMAGDYWLELLDPVLRNCDILMPSYREAAVLTGQTEIARIRETLSGFGVKLLLIKLGGEGCYLTDFNTEWQVPTFPQFKAVDTTGAGDSFVAGFLRGLIEGWTPEGAAIFGNAVASHNVTKVGATAGVPSFDTAYNYIKEHLGGMERFPLKAPG
jgi:ribokinase